jgi:ferredoxin
VAADIIEACAVKREKDLQAFLENEDRFDLLTKCTACGLCVRSCPVCFCPTCNLTAQVRAKEMSKLGFITTRFAHVGDICVECGKCSTNCPMGIPLDLVFQAMRDTFKKKRNYEAGSKREGKVMHLDV